MRPQRPWLIKTERDGLLIQRSRLHPFALVRLRRAFWQEWQSTKPLARNGLAISGTFPRFAFLHQVMDKTFNSGEWDRWRRYLEHDDRDFRDMCEGAYPISPFLQRVYSALFGIRIDFLLLGSEPRVDRMGANIDIWPLAETR